jgi:oxygen-independent coproporphyrinogen-3 oxidase
MKSKIAPAGIYVHIPFCEKKCEYCDFYSITQLNQIDQFIDALLLEIELRSQDYSDTTFHTVFFGGGTPSILSETQMEKIWNSLLIHFQFAEDAEVALEANPGMISFEKIKYFKDFGFNRLSIGVQSFNEQELQFLGRIHTVKQVYETFEHSRNAGFNNINIDLMTAFTGITHHSFQKSLRECIRLSSEHISCYTLIFEPGTPFYKRMKTGQLTPFSEELESEYYILARKILENNGYIHYEISSFAKGEKNICRHNCIYWRHHPYLGLGPSAHSFNKNRRMGNVKSLKVYINKLFKGEIPVGINEVLSEEQLMFEYILLNLRLKNGFELSDFRQKFGITFKEKYTDKIKFLSDNKLLHVNDWNVRLSEKGWMIADSIAANF